MSTSTKQDLGAAARRRGRSSAWLVVNLIETFLAKEAKRKSRQP